MSNENKISVSGYEHPTELILSNPRTNKKYKIFNNGTDKSPYVSSGQKYKYLRYTDKKTQNICPECGEEALYECKCDNKDKQCSNGHVWYINKEGFITKGDPHD